MSVSYGTHELSVFEGIETVLTKQIDLGLHAVLNIIMDKRRWYRLLKSHVIHIPTDRTKPDGCAVDECHSPDVDCMVNIGSVRSESLRRDEFMERCPDGEVFREERLPISEAY